MNEIKIGTPVYHVEEYRLSNYELKQKGSTTTDLKLLNQLL